MENVYDYKTNLYVLSDNASSFQDLERSTRRKPRTTTSLGLGE